MDNNFLGHETDGVNDNEYKSVCDTGSFFQKFLDTVYSRSSSSNDTTSSSSASSSSSTSFLKSTKTLETLLGVPMAMAFAPEAALNATGTAALNATNTAALNTTNTAVVNATNTAALNTKDTAALRATGTAALSATGTAARNAKDTAALSATGTAALNAKDTAALKPQNDNFSVKEGNLNAMKFHFDEVDSQAAFDGTKKRRRLMSEMSEMSEMSPSSLKMSSIQNVNDKDNAGPSAPKRRRTTGKSRDSVTRQDNVKGSFAYRRLY